MVWLPGLIIAIMAFAAAAVLAAATLLVMSPDRLLAGHHGPDDLITTLTGIPAQAMRIAYVAMLPAVLALLVLGYGRWLRWRHFAIAGAIVGLVIYISGTADLAASIDADFVRRLWAVGIAGAAGGTTYWLVACKLFGKGEAQW